MAADVGGKDVLCLASGWRVSRRRIVEPAAGASVTSFDNRRTARKDKFVADRDDLHIGLEKGDAADCRGLPHELDLIFIATECFMPTRLAIWRVTNVFAFATGRALLAGFNNRLCLYFRQHERLKKKQAFARQTRLPYSDAEARSENELESALRLTTRPRIQSFARRTDRRAIAAGFIIAGFYEDYWTDEARLLNRYAPTFIATRAIKP
jgi:hypothetical protein